MLFSFQFSWIFCSCSCSSTCNGPAGASQEVSLLSCPLYISVSSPLSYSFMWEVPWYQVPGVSFDGGRGGNISWSTTVIKKSSKHCTLFVLRIFSHPLSRRYRWGLVKSTHKFLIFNNCSGGNHLVSYSIVKRSYRYFEDFGRDSPAICRPRQGFFHNFDFETVLPVSKTTAVCNLPVSIRFEQRTIRYRVFGCVGTLIQSGYM